MAERYNNDNTHSSQILDDIPPNDAQFQMRYSKEDRERAREFLKYGARGRVNTTDNSKLLLNADEYRYYGIERQAIINYKKVYNRLLEVQKEEEKINKRIQKCLVSGRNRPRLFKKLEEIANQSDIIRSELRHLEQSALLDAIAKMEQDYNK